MPNINDFDQLYRRKITDRAGATSPHRIGLDRIGAHKLRVLTHVTVENETTDYTKCRLGFSNGGRDYYLDELTDPTANELAVSRSDILLSEGDVFFAELTGVTENDVLVMTCMGWEQEL